MQEFGKVMTNHSERRHFFLNQRTCVLSQVLTLFVLIKNV
jgi:hypothetical protein